MDAAGSLYLAVAALVMAVWIGLIGWGVWTYIL